MIISHVKNDYNVPFIYLRFWISGYAGSETSIAREQVIFDFVSAIDNIDVNLQAINCLRRGGRLALDPEQHRRIKDMMTHNEYLINKNIQFVTVRFNAKLIGIDSFYLTY